jgi:hypothetical protein
MRTAPSSFLALPGLLPYGFRSGVNPPFGRFTFAPSSYGHFIQNPMRLRIATALMTVCLAAHLGLELFNGRYFPSYLPRLATHLGHELCNRRVPPTVANYCVWDFAHVAGASYCACKTPTLPE